MTKPEETIDPTFAAALEWFVHLRDEAADADLRQRFEIWRAADPTHAEAFAKAEALWSGFEIAKPSFERQRVKAHPINRRGVLALAGLFVAGAPLVYWASTPGRFADHRTDIAERRTVTLSDGSVVELGSDTALSVDFGPSERRLTLHRGQAFFRVAPDPARPFIVHTPAGSARALGTQFDLRLDEDGATVSVVEHAVELASPAHGVVVVGEGWQARSDASGVSEPRRFDAGVVEAWRRDRIVFEDVPLRRVLRELERYRRGPILLMGEVVGRIPVTAVFEARNTDGALRTIERTIPVRVLKAGGFATLVYPR